MPAVIDDEIESYTQLPKPKLDLVLSAIRQGEESLPSLRRITNLDYAELQLILYQLEFEWRSIVCEENANGFARYFPTNSERLKPKPKAIPERTAWSRTINPAPPTFVTSPVPTILPPLKTDRSSEPPTSARNPETKKPRKRYYYNYYRGELVERLCANDKCRRIFLAKVRKPSKGGTQRYCKSSCGPHSRPYKVPSDHSLLYELYVTQGLTTPAIGRLFHARHHAVRHRLIEVGIPLRKPGSYHPRCVEEGCNEPTFKLTHPINGSPYGTRCEFHRKEHRKKLADDYYARTRGAQSPAPLIINAIREGATNVYQIAERLNMKTKRVSVTLRHMKEQGIVVHAGTFRPKRHSGGRAIIWALAE